MREDIMRLYNRLKKEGIIKEKVDFNQQTYDIIKALFDILNVPHEKTLKEEIMEVIMKRVKRYKQLKGI